MRVRLSPLLLAVLLASFVRAEEAKPFDAAGAREILGRKVEGTGPSRFTAKGLKSAAPDPVASRFYKKDAVIVTRQSGAKQELPFVPISLLFRVNTAEFLDARSRENLQQLARVLIELGERQYVFAVEGHASTEGDPEKNAALSKLRAQRVAEALRELSVPGPTIVRVEGLGSRHASHPNPAQATEAQLQSDRRVLIVRER